MNYVFYCIYNTQYLDGKNKVNKTPWFDALGLMFAGSFCWLAIIIEILYFYVLNRNFPTVSLIGIVIICVFLFYLHYFSFIKDRRFEQIYKKYKSIDGNSRKSEKLICIGYIFVPAFLSMTIAMIWHNIV
jgi:hypothetical protein